MLFITTAASREMISLSRLSAILPRTTTSVTSSLVSSTMSNFRKGVNFKGKNLLSRSKIFHSGVYQMQNIFDKLASPASESIHLYSHIEMSTTG